MLANGINAGELAAHARLCVIRILPIAAYRKSVVSYCPTLSPKTAVSFCDLRHKGGEYGKDFFRTLHSAAIRRVLAVYDSR